MAELVYSEGALEDLSRLAAFLEQDDREGAAATAGLIMDALEILEAHPLVGRPISGGRHELVISRGHTGYLAVYDFDAQRDRVMVLAIRHQREAGFEE